jgi:hypothetical protein
MRSCRLAPGATNTFSFTYTVQLSCRVASASPSAFYRAGDAQAGDGGCLSGVVTHRLFVSGGVDA